MSPPAENAGQRLMPHRAPSVPVPAGACDCHMHIYGDPGSYPVPAGSAFPPVAGGTIDAYLKVRERLGLSRAVVVQPSAYGFDNRCTLDAIARMGDAARGVAVVPPDVAEDELARLTELGIRGERFFMLPGGALGWDDLEVLAAKAAPFGWHIQLQLDGRLLPEFEQRLAALPCPLVIDHNGKFLEPVPTDHPGVLALLRLLESGRCWVKTSGVYETSKSGPPDYPDVAAIARLLIRTLPERCLFATNWPHPSKRNDPPNDAQLIDLFAEWCGDDAVIRRIMVANAAEVYGFGEPAAEGNPAA